MLEYFVLDRQDFKLPVYPIAVLSYKREDSGCQVPLSVDFPNGRVLQFKLDVIDLRLRLLRRRLGELPASQEGAIRKLGLPKIEMLGEALLEFTSRADLTRWLRSNAY